MSQNVLIWHYPMESPDLGSDEVHVWRADLDVPTRRREALFASLSDDEIQRARQFYFERDRHHYIVARGTLRELLGLYLSIPPRRVDFRYRPHGKPILDPHLGGLDLRFNVSHAHGLGLVAVTNCREVGVDVEYVTPRRAGEGIARRFFSSREVNDLLTLAPGERIQAFFNCWTRKEAYIKAIGEGLSFPLNQFTVTLLPDEPPRMLENEKDPREVARWSWFHLEPGAGYVGALAVEGSPIELKLWQSPSV